MNLILRLVLARDDIEVQRVTTQQSVQNLYGRGVRFDVLAVDAAGKLYNCEVQRASEGAIPRRARASREEARNFRRLCPCAEKF